MRIDWTQTLIGSSTSAHELPAGHAGASADLERNVAVLAALNAARLVGVLAATAFIGLTIAALPLRGSATTFSDSLALSGVLVADVLGFLILGRYGWRGIAASAAIGLLALPFAIAAGVSLPIAVALVLLVILDGAMVLMTRSFRRIAPAVLAAGVGLALVGLLGFSEPGFGDAILLATAFAPVAALALTGRDGASGRADHRTQSEAARLSALLNVVMPDAGRQPFVTDIVGTIDHGENPGFHQHLAAERFPEGSIVSATLIADRVTLLQALSRAIREGKPSENLCLRVRHEPIGAGYPMAPRFEAFTCAVFPMPGVAERAIVLLKPAGEGADANISSPHPASKQNAALLVRALHDCTAPFNAGLGFLEMIADPRLAPRDIATYRDFAAEAHKAMSEAHRNSLLLGRWIRLEHMIGDEAARSVEIAPARLLSDAIRVLNLREAVERGEIRLDDPAPLPAARLPLEIARFAVETLLRHTQTGAVSTISLIRNGNDLILSCRIKDDRDEPAEPDAFQLALEAKASAMRAGGFGSDEPGERHLRIAGAFSDMAEVGASASGRPVEVGHARLAS